VQSILGNINGGILAIGLDPGKLISKWGLLGLALIVFAESGLFFGFFLPGDSLLFAAGLFTANGKLDQSIWVVALTCFAAAVLGDQVGYLFGKRVGPELFDKPKSRLFNPKHVVKANEYFDHHGPKTILIARFVPIVRTFAPIVAGVANMKYRTFIVFNVLGGLLWGVGVTVAGWALGKKFPSLADRIELLGPIIILISLIPVLLEFRKHRAAKKLEESAQS
jgi:membrane-associated protein